MVSGCKRWRFRHLSPRTARSHVTLSVSTQGMLQGAASALAIMPRPGPVCWAAVPALVPVSIGRMNLVRDTALARVRARVRRFYKNRGTTHRFPPPVGGPGTLTRSHHGPDHLGRGQHVIARRIGSPATGVCGLLLLSGKTKAPRLPKTGVQGAVIPPTSVTSVTRIRARRAARRKFSITARSRFLNVAGFRALPDSQTCNT